MGLFDDPNLLTNRSFSWGLGPYVVPPELLEEFPDDISKLSLFVTDDGTVNVDEQLYLYKESDPIDSAVEQTYSKNNLFIAGLKKAIGPFPTYGILVFPTILPGSREVVSESGFFGPIYGAGERVKFPRDTPEGFVPCAGQLLRYPGGETIVVPKMGSASVTSGAGDGATTSVVYYAPPGGAYMMKVPEGYVEMIPDLTGKDLGDFGTPTSTLGGIFG